MNQKQAQKFIDKVLCPNIIEVEFCNEKSGFVGYADLRYGAKIFLNTHEIKKSKYNNVGIKGVMLHEMGHILGGHLKTTAKNELCAQLFALKVADKFKMVRVFKRLLLEFSCWGMREWNKADAKFYRPYYEAYRLFLKDEKLVRKYAKKDKKIGAVLLYDLKHPLPRKPKVV